MIFILQMIKLRLKAIQILSMCTQQTSARAKIQSKSSLCKFIALPNTQGKIIHRKNPSLPSLPSLLSQNGLDS